MPHHSAQMRLRHESILRRTASVSRLVDPLEPAGLRRPFANKLPSENIVRADGPIYSLRLPPSFIPGDWALP